MSKQACPKCKHLNDVRFQSFCSKCQYFLNQTPAPSMSTTGSPYRAQTQEQYQPSTQSSSNKNRDSFRRRIKTKPIEEVKTLDIIRTIIFIVVFLSFITHWWGLFFGGIVVAIVLGAVSGAQKKPSDSKNSYRYRRRR